MTPHTLKFKLGVDTFTSKSLFDFKSVVQEPLSQHNNNMWASKSCRTTLQVVSVSPPKWLSCWWLCSWLGAETADKGRLAASQQHRERTESQPEKDACGKRTLIKTLCVFVNPGIWELKLADWINIFSPPQATVLYLTFWKFIWVNLAAEATDSGAVNNTSPPSPEHSHTHTAAERRNTFFKPYFSSFSSSNSSGLKLSYLCLHFQIT